MENWISSEPESSLLASSSLGQVTKSQYLKTRHMYMYVTIIEFVLITCHVLITCDACM